MEKNKNYTVLIYAENRRVLNRVLGCFQRRQIDIESINMSQSEINGVYKITLVACLSEVLLKKIIGQLDKQIDIIKAYYHSDDNTIYQETCLFKLNTELLVLNNDVQTIINKSLSKVINVSHNFFVLEKTGSKEEIEALYKALNKQGIMQFVRSGRIAISKQEMNISTLLSVNN